MSLHIDKMREARHLIERIESLHGKRSLNIGFTILGEYVEGEFDATELEMAERIRTRYLDRKIKEVRGELEALGVSTVES